MSVNSVFPEGELDAVRLVIVRQEPRAVTVNLAEQGLPFTQGLVHRGGSFDVSITAEGIFESVVVVTQLIPIEQFVQGETLQVGVVLSPSCIGVTCEGGSSCMAGNCVV